MIEGRVVDVNGAPVCYASVALLSDGRIETGRMTDTSGTFVFMGHFNGKYDVRVSYVGYKDVTKSLECGREHIMDLGRIAISQDTCALDGAVVASEASAKSVYVEKTRIRPSSRISSATGSVLDAIRSASAVSVDGDGNVSIRGNSNVLILVDGVPTTLGGLGAIPLANVGGIDVVTSPDVKYDSEGTGGIINIISKNPLDNYFRSMVSVSYDFATFLTWNLAVSGASGKWRLRANYNGKYEEDLIRSELHRQIKASGNSVDQFISAGKRTDNQTAGLQAYRMISKNRSLTVDFRVMFPKMNNFQNFTNHYLKDGVPGDLFRQTDITFNREVFEGSMKYSRGVRTGHLDFTATFSSTAGHRPSYYYEEGVMVQKSESGGHPFNASLQADHSRRLGGGQFDTGVKMTYRQNNIDHRMYELNPSSGGWEQSFRLSNDLLHRECIPAVYAKYGSESDIGIGSFKYNAGVRLEYSRATLQSVKENLDDHGDCWFLAPNVALTWAGSVPITLSLSRRISRPTYPQLNPYINLIDNQTYETGNIRLRPEKANRIDLGYSWRSVRHFSLSGSIYLVRTKGFINQVAGIHDGILMMTYINGEMDTKAGMSHNIKITPSEKFSVDISSDTYYTESQETYEGAGIHNMGWVNNSNIEFDFKPVKGMTLQAEYFLTTPQYFPQFTTKTVHYGNLGLSQSLFKGALTASATLTDVFDTMRWDISSDNSVYTLVNNSKNQSRMLLFGLTWNFNSYRQVKSAKAGQEEDRSMLRIGD